MSDEPIVTLEAMRDEVERIVVMLECIPPKQRTPAIQKLLDSLADLLDEYDNAGDDTP
jgi:hypothetical protein